MADATPALRRLWNIGAKVVDVGAEAAFLERLGGRKRLHEGQGAPDEYAFVDVGATRVLLTTTPIYEGKLGAPMPAGWTHTVFEAGGDHADTCRRIEVAGAEPLMKSRRLEAGYGKRDVAFFRSPGGLIFEALHIIEDHMD